MSAFSDYLETISQVNDLGSDLRNAHPVQWLFHSGMLFSTWNKWWGDFRFRQSAHEGIDITYFRTIPDKLRQFDTSIKVPAMADGVIVNICDDFLGQTLVVEHENSLGFNRRILFVYAHIIPEKSLKPGHIIKKGAVIARVCDTHKNPKLPPHLHFSCAEVSKQVRPEQLNWNLFSKSRDINLIHPVFL